MIQSRHEAPSFMARTLIGISPCPVMKMMGKETPDVKSSFWNSNPVRPGNLTIEDQAAWHVEPVRIHKSVHRFE